MADNRQFEMHTNTFMKGMNKELDYSLMPSEAYLHAENLRLVADESNSTGSLESVRGNELISDNSIYGGYKYIGSASRGEKLILFLVSPDDNFYLRKVLFDGDSIVSNDLIYTDKDLDSNNKLGYSKNTNIKAILRYEGDNIERLYWLDGTNNLRRVNIAKPITSDGEDKNINNSYKVINSSEGSNQGIFGFDSISLYDILDSGELKSGSVQYAYRLISSDGSKSIISPLTRLYHIAPSSEDNDTYNYKGGKGATEDESSESASKSYKIKVNVPDNIVNNYNKIRLFSIFYESLSQEPIINYTDNYLTDESTNQYITDSGANYKGSITVNELLEGMVSSTASSSETIPKSLASKNNRLFKANITTSQIEDEIKNFINNEKKRNKMFNKVIEENDFFGNRVGYEYSKSCLVDNCKKIMKKIQDEYENNFKILVYGELPKFDDVVFVLKTMVNFVAEWEQDNRKYYKKH